MNKKQRKMFSVPKNKKCRCGKKITHHHFLCNACWNIDNKTNKLKRNAMEKNVEYINRINKIKILSKLNNLKGGKIK